MFTGASNPNLVSHKQNRNESFKKINKTNPLRRTAVGGRNSRLLVETLHSYRRL